MSDPVELIQNLADSAACSTLQDLLSPPPRARPACWEPHPSLKDIETPIRVGLLASAIEKFGIWGWDRFGRFACTDEINKSALDALAVYYEWQMHQFNEWLVQRFDADAESEPSFTVEDYPSAESLAFFAWPYERLPNFKELESQIDLRPMPKPPRKSAETRRIDTLLVLVAALSKRAKIDVDARGAAARLREATELIGAPIHEDTISHLLGLIRDAVDKRSR